MRAFLLVGLLTAGTVVGLAPTATATYCDPDGANLHCWGILAEEIEVTVHWHIGHQGHYPGAPDDDMAEVCFVNGDPTDGLIGDCRGILLPDVEL